VTKFLAAWLSHNILAIAIAKEISLNFISSHEKVDPDEK
jgi:hypothetical protein